MSLPDNLHVRGRLDLAFCENLTSLPTGLKVDGDLILTFAKITSLPDNLQVGKYLDLGNTKITSLPKGLKVGSRLNISGTQITSLPKGLKVGENLLIMNTNLKKYTDEELREMVKPGFIKGEIYRG
jgi:Leucine-rich repeat (LRR) protein